MELHDEDWELVNDDGFIYKRLKRPTVEQPTISTAPPPDPAAEETNRKKRKKVILLKLKTRYQQEILHWEHLSNTLQALQHQTQTQPPPIVLPDLPLTLLTQHSSDYREVADTLLAQVEAQEALMNEVSALCNVAESFCNSQEQLLNQPFVYLPIWEPSPRKLIAMLCEE